MPVISVTSLSKHYRVHQKDPGLSGSIKSFVRRKSYDVKAVDDINFLIGEGELVGFLGPNGAGKTTTLKVLSGLLYPTKGEVSVLGFTPWRREPALQRQFSLVMGQKNQLWWDLPAMESLLLNKEIYDIPQRQFHETLDELVSLLDLEKLLNVQVRKLSLGERMKCELVTALLHRPRVLFLDEPTIGLDVVMQKKIREFIKEYNAFHHSTILLTSHDMEDVEELCERIIIIDRGNVIYDGRLDEIVSRYAKQKTLVVTFDKAVLPGALRDIGEVLSYDTLKVTLCVPRAETSARAALLLSRFAVADLTIEEPAVDDIIRDIFTGREAP
ncbi:MAG: ATP-binding cassette domain-containing protein [Candidatus Latescibacteria bacterium]|nr:ATP-binding cassette domain-containing protein [Candidatus Latescibacterota bacterium]